jgi:hypothetical protein
MNRGWQNAGRFRATVAVAATWLLMLGVMWPGLVAGATIQYSLPYLKASVVDLGLPEFVNHLIPIVKASLKAHFPTPLRASGRQE